MKAEPVEGRCFCGAIRYSYSGPPNWILHCHCESCRRATSSPMTTWISVARSSFKYTTGTPRYFASSPGVQRAFCGDCGGQLTYENDQLPDEVHIYAAGLDDPADDAITPSRHVFVREQLPWFEVHDQLPRYAGTSKDPQPIRIGPKT